VANDEIISFDENIARDLMRMRQEWRSGALTRANRRRRTPIMDGSGGGCDTQNAIIDVIILGSPTGGTFDMALTINSVTEVLTFNYDDTTSEVDTELSTHSELVSADVTVTGGPFPDATMRIEFIGDQANTNIALPTTDWSGLTGGTGTGIICVMAQLGHA